MKNDPPSGWLSLEVMGQKNWDDPAKKWRERRAVAEKSGEAESSISVEIVCFTPAGKSLINSGLVHYLTDLKDEKKTREKRERERRMTEERKGRLAGRTRNVLYLWRNGLAGGL